MKLRIDAYKTLASLQSDSAAPLAPSLALSQAQKHTISQALPRATSAH